MAPKVRDMSSISKMIDAGSVLVESACSIDRVDEGLRTLLPLIPGRGLRSSPFPFNLS
jgi:hypothetical protein